MADAEAFLPAWRNRAAHRDLSDALFAHPHSTCEEATMGLFSKDIKISKTLPVRPEGHLLRRESDREIVA
jgi:hypothetical protein